MYVPCIVCVGEARQGEGVTSVIPADVYDGEVTVGWSYHCIDAT